MEIKVIQQEQKAEPVYLFRRKGLDYFCTCDRERYDELASKPHLFEVKILFETAHWRASKTASAASH